MRLVSNALWHCSSGCFTQNRFPMNIWFQTLTALIKSDKLWPWAGDYHCSVNYSRTLKEGVQIWLPRKPVSELIPIKRKKSKQQRPTREKHVSRPLGKRCSGLPLRDVWSWGKGTDTRYGFNMLCSPQVQSCSAVVLWGAGMLWFILRMSPKSHVFREGASGRWLTHSYLNFIWRRRVW